MGVSITKNGKMLKQWHQIFHERWAFIMPLQHKNNFPSLVKSDMSDAIKMKLSYLSKKDVKWCCNVMLPQMLKEVQASDNKQAVREPSTDEKRRAAKENIEMPCIYQ